MPSIMFLYINRFNSSIYIKAGLLNTIIFSLIFIVFGCGKAANQTTQTDDYSNIVDTANRILDAKQAQKAVNYLDSATAKYKNLDLLQRFYYYNFNCTFYYHKQNNKEKAMLYADSMLNLFDTPEKKLKYTAKYGQAYFLKGDILFDENKYDEAYQYYYQGKIIASNSLDDCILSDYSYRMGMIMYKQEHYKVAAGYFKTSTAQANTCDLNITSFYRRQELLNNTGLSYSKIGMTDSALLFYAKALDYINSSSTQFREKDLIDAARGVVYGNEANIYIKDSNIKLAENLLKKSISINLRKGYDNNDAQLSELKLAHLYSQENKSDSLAALLQTVRLQFDTIKNLDAEADWNQLMANYYVTKGQPQLAYNYLARYDSIKDSINSREKQLKEADITEQMSRLSKNYELEGLRKNNQLQYIYLKIAIVFGLMLLLIIFLIYRNWEKSKKNIKALGNLNNQVNDRNNHLETALNELNQSSREKDRILRTVAHDLRNPLGGIAALTGLMAEEIEYTAEQKEHINLIRETSNNSLELINEILEATDNTLIKINKEKEPVEINTLVNHSVELLRFKAAEKQQHIQLEMIGTQVELFISREKIWRVISNLISNAIKFSANNTNILVKLSNYSNHVTITVKDNGIGIPEEMKSKVFNMFTDAKRPGTAGEKSFGLGLSICQQIIENHGGKIWFESDIKTGTTFYVRLNKRL